MIALLPALVLFAADPEAARWSADVAPLTDVPLHMGARVGVESPQRIRAGASAGVLPGLYVDMINAAAVAAGGYDEDTARLVKKTLQRSLVLRASGGWRPFAARGFYAEAGYTWISLGGDVAGEDLVTLATGVEPPGALSSNREYDVNSTLHLVGFELGWEWQLRALARKASPRGVAWRSPLRVRAAIGFASTVAAETTIEPRFDPIAPVLVDEFTTQSEDHLDETYRKYVHVPVITVAVGWRF